MYGASLPNPPPLPPPRATAPVALRLDDEGLLAPAFRLYRPRKGEEGALVVQAGVAACCRRGEMGAAGAAAPRDDEDACERVWSGVGEGVGAGAFQLFGAHHWSADANR